MSRPFKELFNKIQSFGQIFLISFMAFGIVFYTEAQNTKPGVTVDDFQKINSMTINKSAWYTYSDVYNGGKSVIAFSYQKEDRSKNKYLTVKYKLEQAACKWIPYAALSCSLNIKQFPVGVQAIAYEFKGDSHNFIYRSDDNKDYAFYQKNISESKEWTTVTIPVSELVQPYWGIKKPLSEADLYSFSWLVKGESGDSGSFSIDNIRLLYTPQLVLNSEKNSQSEINYGFRETIHSSILNEDRELWISLPRPLEEIKANKNRYPVVYLLDGNYHIKSISSMVQQLGKQYGNMILPEMIIVGISNTNRWRDLTPGHVDRTPFPIDSSFLVHTGGGENFIKFIEKELIPHIDLKYPTCPYRAFVGHSLGGLTVLNTLIHHPHIFNSYLSIDPSLWYNDQLLSKQAESLLDKAMLQNKHLFLAIGNTLSEGYDHLTIRNDTTNDALHMRNIFEFTDILKSNPNSGLSWDYVYYPYDNHQSVPVIAHYDGLRYIFDFYRMKFSNEIGNEDFDFKSAITLHYNNISKEFGYDVSYEEVVNSYGYRFIRMKKYKQALSCFKINTDHYPNSSNAWDSLGDAYVNLGDIPNAVQSYSKALSIAEHPQTRKKLKELQELQNE